VAAETAVVMGCRIAHLPIKYRRIPLSLRRLSAAALQPMVDRIADCLPKWKVVMLAKVGRLALVKSVLAALPLHQLVVLGVNVRALKQVEKILRGFLWVGRKEAHGGHCHVNSRRVCHPLELGGLGIPISLGWRSASACGGSGGCVRTPTGHGMG
jgi:hypothetical protein